METSNYGSTNHPVSRLGLGLAALGRPGYINLGHAEDLPGTYQVDAMRDHAHTVLDAAWSAGVRYFDTARSYGRGEEFLASWLSRFRDLSGLTVGSKWGYTYTADWQSSLPTGTKHEVKDHNREVLDRQIDESRSLLGKHLNIYHIHSATHDSGVLKNDDVLSRLAELRDEGLIIGFSTSGPQQSDTIREGLSIERAGKPLFQSVQATWNVLEQSAGTALAEAHRSGRGVIVKEALANGRLTARNDDRRFIERNERLYQVAKSNDVTIDAISIACAMRQPWVDVVLSGAATVEHLTANLRACELIDDNGLDVLLELAETPEDYWQTRSQLAWN